MPEAILGRLPCSPASSCCRKSEPREGKQLAQGPAAEGGMGPSLHSCHHPNRSEGGRESEGLGQVGPGPGRLLGNKGPPGVCLVFTRTGHGACFPRKEAEAKGPDCSQTRGSSWAPGSRWGPRLLTRCLSLRLPHLWSRSSTRGLVPCDHRTRASGSFVSNTGQDGQVGPCGSQGLGHRAQAVVAVGGGRFQNWV